MGDLGAGGGGNQRGNAGIAEQVQDLDRTLRRFDDVLHPGPVDLLFGENPDVTEAGEATMKIDAEQLHRPGFAKRALGEAPAAHAVLISVAGEDGVHLLPMSGGKRPLPERLRFRTDDTMIAILLELLACAAVDEAEAAGGGVFEDDRDALARLFAAARHQRPLGLRRDRPLRPDGSLLDARLRIARPIALFCLRGTRRRTAAPHFRCLRQNSQFPRGQICDCRKNGSIGRK